jgi:predicted ATP-grasp superfamily ATP-dependent carboligase
LGQAVTPDPLLEPVAFLNALQGLIERWQIDTLIPIAEPALLVALEARTRLGVDIPFPALNVFRRICDKQELLGAAPSLGIAVPRQIVVERPADIEDGTNNWSEFPVVIKPARSVSELNGKRSKQGVSYANTEKQLRAQLHGLPQTAFPVLLQERVEGPGVGIFLLIHQGQVQAQFAHRRIREKPPSGGVSVYRESTAADPALVESSRALLERFDWNGVAMVEYKLDARSGVPFLMEVNGRFWGSLQLAVDAGVDFPVLLLRGARGETISPPAYRVGVRSRWWWGDVDQLIIRLRHAATDLNLAPGVASRWRSVLDFLHLWRPGDQNEVFRWHDPMPFLRESIDWFAGR